MFRDDDKFPTLPTLERFDLQEISDWQLRRLAWDIARCDIAFWAWRRQRRRRQAARVLVLLVLVAVGVLVAALVLVVLYLLFAALVLTLAGALLTSFFLK